MNTKRIYSAHSVARSFAFQPLVLVCVGGLLAIVSVVQFRSEAEVSAASFYLSSIIPRAISGWTVRDIPVAESPEVRKATETILRYDDFAFREYRRGDFLVQVYVSAWMPGKMDARDVAIHNPDNCWTANGFTRLDDASKRLVEIAGRRVANGHFRRFEARGNRLDVAYWLMVDGRPFMIVDESTRSNALVTRFTAFCRTVWFGIVAQGKRTPIYFVRLSSAQDLEAGLADPSLQPLITSLLPLIAGADPTR